MKWVIDMDDYKVRIRELREDHALTQKEVADILHTTQQVYSRYETGQNEMPIRHLVVLCNYYDVSADFILGRTSVKRGKREKANHADV